MKEQTPENLPPLTEADISDSDTLTDAALVADMLRAERADRKPFVPPNDETVAFIAGALLDRDRRTGEPESGAQESDGSS